MDCAWHPPAGHRVASHGRVETAGHRYGCVGVLGTPGPGAGRGQTPGPGQDAPWGPGGARWAELRGRWHPNRTGHPRAQGSRHPLPSLPLLQRHRNSVHVGFSSAGKLWVGLHPPVEVCDPWHGTATAPGCGDPLNPRCDPRVGFPPQSPHPRPCAPRAGVCPRAMAGWWRCGGRCPPRALAHGVSPQAVSHARAGVRVSGCPGVPRRGQEAAGGAAGGGGAFSVHPGSGGAAASGLQLEPGSAASSAGGDSGVPPAAGRAGLGAGMNLGIGVQRVPSCTLSPSPLPAGEVGTHPALLNTFGCCFVPSPCSPGPDTTMRGVARLVSVSPPRWHRGPLAGGGGGRGFPGRWRSSASAGTRREPGPLPPSASSTSKSCQIRVL